VFQTGHASSIGGVALSADGRLIVSQAADQTVRIWDVASGQELRAIGDVDRDARVAFIGDTARVVVGAGTAATSVIDAGTGRRSTPLAEEGTHIAVSAQGRFAALVSSDGTNLDRRATANRAPITVIDLSTGRTAAPLPVTDWATPLAVSDDGRLLLVQRTVADAKRMTRMLSQGKLPFPEQHTEVWDVASGKHQPLKIEIPNGGGGAPPVMSPDRKLLAVTELDSTIAVYELANGKPRGKFAPDPSSQQPSVNSVVFSPDSRLIARGAYASGVSVWDIASGTRITHFEGTAVNFGADSNTLVVGAMTGGAPFLRDLRTGSETALAGSASAILDVALVDDGRLVVAATEAGGARLWDLATGQMVRTFACAPSIQVQSVAVSVRQPLLVTGCRDGSVLLWNLRDGALLKTLLAPAAAGSNFVHTMVRFDPTGARLATAVNTQVSVWDAATLAKVRSFALPVSSVFSDIADSLKDSPLLPAGARDAALAPLTNANVQAAQNAVFAMAFHPDGRRLAIGRPTSLTLWDTSTGQLARTFRVAPEAARDDVGGLVEAAAQNGTVALSFSPDGRRLIALGGEDATVWDVETARAITDARPQEAAGQSDTAIENLGMRGVAASPDGRFAARSRGHNVEVWEVENGRPVASLAGHLSDVTSIAYAAGGRLLVSGSRDGALRLWSWPDGKPLIQLIALGASDFVAVTPDQYYRASQRRISGVSFRIGGQLYPFEQFDLRFNRPDVVLARLGRSSPDVVQAYRGAYERRLRRMGIDESALTGNSHAPDVQIDTNVPVTTNAASLSLRVRASDSQYPLDRLNVFLNDVPVFGTAGLAVPDRKALSVTQEIQVPLVPGRNKIQVSVLNQQGTESLKQTAYTASTATFAPPDVYLVAIGVSEYRNRAYNLRFAAKDAADLTSAYQAANQRGGARGTVHVLDLTNAKATRSAIRDAKGWLKQAKSNDLVVVFAAGHGMTDTKQNYYFGTHDIDPEHPETNGLPYEDFEGLLDGIASLQKMLLIDTCFSGEIDKDEATVVAQAKTAGTVKMRAFKAARGVTLVGDDSSASVAAGLSTDVVRFQQDLFSDLRRGTGAVVISSASGNEYALEGDQWSNGVFTYALLNGLKNAKADKNADSRITVSELQGFVIEQVRELTAGGQNPTVRRENLDYDFDVFMPLR
jgi:WD40 repeat protein